MSPTGTTDRVKEETKLHSRVRVALLVVFLLLAAGLYLLDSRGTHLGQFSESGSVALFLAVLFCAAAAYEFLALVILVTIKLRRGAAGEVRMLTSFTRVVAVAAVIIALMSATGMLKGVSGLMALVGGSMLGWSLQSPISGMAAWALITLMRPFRVGDRVLFPVLGLSGDVLEVGFMYTKLDQVGGSVGSEEAIGRHILIPNAMLFSQVAINYTPQQRAAYFLDEVVIRLTYDSDWDTAEKILLDAAREVTADIIKQTGREPYIRSDNYDYGVYMRLRYMTLATDRPRLTHEILKCIFKEIQRNPRVDHAIPFVYSYRRGMEGTGRGGAGENVIELDISLIDDLEPGATLSADEKKDLEQLAERIQRMGLLQPIVVHRMQGGRYLLVAGRLRLLACKSLGWKAIPVVVKNGGAGWTAES